MEHQEQQKPLDVPGLAAPLSAQAAQVARESARPRYALEGHEDEVYHELRLGERGTEPEYCAFLDKSWTFNRAMRWLNGPLDTLLCYETDGDLPLTGERQVSAWFSDPENQIRQMDAETTRFVKRTTRRRRDCVVLPGLQFNLEQHPTLDVMVTSTDAEWQFCALMKGRSGAPLVAGEWQSGPGTFSFDLAGALRRRGYTLQFAELHIVMGLWTATPETQAQISFSMRLPGRAAVVPCLPVVRAVQTAASAGVPLAALVVSAKGQCLSRSDVSLVAILRDRRVPLEERDGVWRVSFPGLAVGEYAGKLVAEGAVRVAAPFVLRVTDGRYFGYDSAKRSLTRGGKPQGPLNGSYFGIAFVKDAGLPAEAIVQGQQVWDAWDRSKPLGEHWHYWEALTEKELETCFAYLEMNGWNLLHLSQHWGIWEKLDAGGRIAPHGAEQAALYMRVAARHNLALLQALSHYPYGGAYTPPVRQYLEAGFQKDDWFNPKTTFTEHFHQYLRDYVTLFREETALWAMTTSGEGDIAAGPDRVNDTCRFVTALDQNHLFMAEPIHRLTKLPRDHRAGWKPKLAGSRLYWIGTTIEEPETDVGVEYKFLQTGDYFMGECCWPCMPLYARFMGLEKNTWAGTERYRTRVRDSFYLGLVHRIPILLSWDELCTEDEHTILNQVRQLIDWDQPFLTPSAAIRVDERNILPEDGRRCVAAYERFFSALPLMTRYLPQDEPVPAGVQAVFDARMPYHEPAFVAQGGTLPDVIRTEMPLCLSPGYRASYAWSADRRTLLAYIYNCTHHAEYPGTGLDGKWHRLPNPVPFSLTIGNLPAVSLTAKLYDLTAKTIVSEKTISGTMRLETGITANDYLVLVTP